MTEVVVSRDDMMKTLRAEAIKDTELSASKQRFALFSQPPPLGIGDNSHELIKRHPRDAQGKGKPITELPNIKVKGPREGKIKSSYFQQMDFVTIGDPYVDPERQKRIQELAEKKGVKNDAIFKPASGYKEIINAPYEHKTDIDILAKKKSYRDKDNKVISAPKNITTNLRAKGLYVFPKFEKDEYSRYRDGVRDDWEASKKLMREQPFKSTVGGGVNFNNDKKAFGLEGEMPPKKPQKETKLNIRHHDQAFKPSNPAKSGTNATITPFPEYKGDPLKPLVRVDPVKGKEAFKYHYIVYERPNNGGNLSRPTPTVSCYPQNIRREMQSKGQ